MTEKDEARRKWFDSLPPEDFDLVLRLDERMEIFDTALRSYPPGPDRMDYLRNRILDGLAASMFLAQSLEKKFPGLQGGKMFEGISATMSVLSWCKENNLVIGGMS